MRSHDLDFYSFVTSFGLFIFEKWCKSTFKKYHVENFLNNFFFFVGILKVNDENRRIRIRIRFRKWEKFGSGIKYYLLGTLPWPGVSTITAPVLGCCAALVFWLLISAARSRHLARAVLAGRRGVTAGVVEAGIAVGSVAVAVAGFMSRS